MSAAADCLAGRVATNWWFCAAALWAKTDAVYRPGWMGRPAGAANVSSFTGVLTCGDSGSLDRRRAREGARVAGRAVWRPARAERSGRRSRVAWAAVAALGTGSSGWGRALARSLRGAGSADAHR